MNKRIRELAIEAGYKHPDAVGMCEDYAYFDHEKFAELIVQECIKQARKDENGLAYEAVGRIAKYFGAKDE